MKPQLRREEEDNQQSHLKEMHRHKNPSQTCPSASRGFGSRAVWSRQGQTVARHPEVLPLCLCTATRCNLLLWDKTKLTRHFTADLAVLTASDQLGGVKRLQELESITVMVNFRCFPSSLCFLTLWYSRLFSHSSSLWIDRLVCRNRTQTH